MRGVFYLLSLGEVVRPFSASHKSLGVVTFLNLLTYLVYYGFGRVSSPVFINFVQDLVEILMSDCLLSRVSLIVVNLIF